MTGKFVRQGDNTSVEFEYEYLSPMPEQTIEDMAHLLWGRELGDHEAEVGTGEYEDEEEEIEIMRPITFEDLEEQDHLDIVDAYLKRVILDMADQHVDDTEVAAAHLSARAISQLRHSLGENDA